MLEDCTNEETAFASFDKYVVSSVMCNGMKTAITSVNKFDRASAIFRLVLLRSTSILSRMRLRSKDLLISEMDVVFCTCILLFFQLGSLFVLIGAE